MRLPLVEENVVDLFVDVNTTMFAADGLIVGRVTSIRNTVPASPSNNERIAVSAGGSGIFAGNGGKLAIYRATGNYWNFYDAVLAVLDDKLYLSFGNNWILKS